MSGFRVLNKYLTTRQNIDYHVVVALVDDIPTKYITRFPWDCETIGIRIVDGEVKYFDKMNREILVYEQDEPEWNFF